MLLILLFVQESLKNPSCLNLDKVAVLVPLDGENPSASNKAFAGYLPEIDQLKDIVVNPGLIFLEFSFKEVLDILLLIRGGSFLSGSIWSLELGCLKAGSSFLSVLIADSIGTETPVKSSKLAQ